MRVVLTRHKQKKDTRTRIKEEEENKEKNRFSLADSAFGEVKHFGCCLSSVSEARDPCSNLEIR